MSIGWNKEEETGREKRESFRCYCVWSLLLYVRSLLLSMVESQSIATQLSLDRFKYGISFSSAFLFCLVFVLFRLFDRYSYWGF